MTTRHLLDPEILPLIDAFAPLSLDKAALPIIRQSFADMVELTDAQSLGVVRREIHVPGLSAEHPPVRCLVYTPDSDAPHAGAYLHLHGGGYIISAPDNDDARNTYLCSRLGIVIVSVDYRLAPEHPAPAALDDSYAALSWMHQNAGDLGIDTDKIAVGGESAGGGLAAALALFARDEGTYPICGQLLTYPMLDDRTGSDSHPADPLTGEFIWTQDYNQTAWGYYLGSAEPSAPSVPARADNLDALPPAWISTGSQDLFRDENIDYAQRLLKAGVSTELIVYPGVCHGFQMMADARVSRQYYRDQEEALARALNVSLS